MLNPKLEAKISAIALPLMALATMLDVNLFSIILFCYKAKPFLMARN